MKIQWLGQGGFLFESDSFRLVVDPYMSNCLEKIQSLPRMHPFPVALKELKPDALLATHDHLDHLDPDTVMMIRMTYPACVYGGPRHSYDHFLKLEIPPEMTTLLTPAESVSFGPFRITPVFAAHSDPTGCGFLIEAEGKKVYLSGDTCYDERLLSDTVKNVDLMLVCINGKLNNMNAEEALRCVKELKPKAALPMHIGLFAVNTADPSVFVDGCRKMGVNSFAMTPGKEFEI